MKKWIAAVAVGLIALWGGTSAHAQLLFTISPASVSAHPGDSFGITADVFNTNGPGGDTYQVDSYSLTVTEPGLALPDDLSDDPTSFLINFQRSFAPGEFADTSFLDFALSPTAPVGTFTINVGLVDPFGTGLAQQSFLLHIQRAPASVPEPGAAAILGSGVGAGTMCYRRRWRLSRS